MANSPASYWMKKDKCHRAWWKNKDKVRGHVTQTCPLLSTWRAALPASCCNSCFLLSVDKMMIYGSCWLDGWVSLQAISNSLLLTVKRKFFSCLIQPSQLVCGATVTIICKKITLGTVYFSLKVQLCPIEMDRSFAIDFKEEGWVSFISSTFWCVPAALATARGDNWEKWVALHCKTQFIFPGWSTSLQYHVRECCVLWVLWRLDRQIQMALTTFVMDQRTRWIWWLYIV